MPSLDRRSTAVRARDFDLADAGVTGRSERAGHAPGATGGCGGTGTLWRVTDGRQQLNAAQLVTLPVPVQRKSVADHASLYRPAIAGVRPTRRARCGRLLRTPATLYRQDGRARRKRAAPGGWNGSVHVGRGLGNGSGALGAGRLSGLTKLRVCRAAYQTPGRWGLYHRHRQRPKAGRR